MSQPIVVILCRQTKKLTTMSKITTFSGQPQYLQILNLANRAKIQEISKQNNYDRYVKKLDGYTHFVALLFAVLMRYDSLRETVIGLMARGSEIPTPRHQLSGAAQHVVRSQ